VRKTLIALAAMMGLIGLGSVAASAAPRVQVHTPQASAIQQADWYCGPRCEYWRHRRWEQRHSYWRERPYYGYNYYNPHYGYNYGYRYR
jgi:hypothetical protein